MRAGEKSPGCLLHFSGNCGIKKNSVNREERENSVLAHPRERRPPAESRLGACRLVRPGAAPERGTGLPPLPEESAHPRMRMRVVPRKVWPFVPVSWGGGPFIFKGAPMEEPSKWTDPTEEKTKNAPDHDPPEPSPQESQPGTVAAETPELEDQRAAHKLLYQCSIVLFFVHLFAILFYIPLYAVNANPASLLGGAHGGGRGRALAVGLLLSLIPPVLPIAYLMRAVHFLCLEL